MSADPVCNNAARTAILVSLHLRKDAMEATIRKPVGGHISQSDLSVSLAQPSLLWGAMPAFSLSDRSSLTLSFYRTWLYIMLSVDGISHSGTILTVFLKSSSSWVYAAVRRKCGNDWASCCKKGLFPKHFINSFSTFCMLLSSLRDLAERAHSFELEAYLHVSFLKPNFQFFHHHRPLFFVVLFLSHNYRIKATFEWPKKILFYHRHPVGHLYFEQCLHPRNHQQWIGYGCIHWL